MEMITPRHLFCCGKDGLVQKSLSLSYCVLVNSNKSFASLSCIHNNMVERLEISFVRSCRFVYSNLFLAVPLWLEYNESDLIPHERLVLCMYVSKQVDIIRCPTTIQ